MFYYYILSPHGCYLGGDAVLCLMSSALMLLVRR